MANRASSRYRMSELPWFREYPMAYRNWKYARAWLREALEK
jgi:hypothetical protein